MKELAHNKIMIKRPDVKKEKVSSTKKWGGVLYSGFFSHPVKNPDAPPLKRRPDEIKHIISQ